MGRAADPSDATLIAGSVPPGTTELGIDIIKVERIADALSRFGARFPRRILTDAENAYVRDRPETLAGRSRRPVLVRNGHGTSRDPRDPEHDRRRGR